MLKIDNLSNEIDMTSVHGAGNQGILQVGASQAVLSGGGLTVAAQYANQNAYQVQTISNTTNVVDLFGLQGAFVANAA